MRVTGDALCVTWSIPVIWGCIVIIIVLVSFNFIPQRSHHSLTLPRSQIRDSATATQTPGDGTTAMKVESSALPNQTVFQNGKKHRSVQQEQYRAQYTSLRQSYTKLTNLLRQPSTITCYDRSDRKCLNILQRSTDTEFNRYRICNLVSIKCIIVSLLITQNLQYPQSRAHRECPNGWP